MKRRTAQTIRGSAPAVRRVGRWVVTLIGIAVLCRLTACGGAEDELATLDFLLCEEDARCEDGVCTRSGEEVETVPVLARAVESTEASRFAPDGLYVLATWEVDDRWVELEVDVPTDRTGYVDHDFRYAEYIDGEPVFRAAETRGRVVFVESIDGGLPYAGHLELRMVDSEGEVRLIHLGHLRPDAGDAVADPGPPDDPIEWGRAGIEVIFLQSEPDEATQPVPYEDMGYYYYDYREGADPFVEIVAAGCETSAEACYGTSYYYEDGEGEVVYYSEEDTGSCSGENDVYYYEDDSGEIVYYSEEDSGSCSGEDDVYYYDDTDKGSCSCWSDDDVWEEDTESTSCSSDSDDYYYYEEDTSSFCGDSSESGSCDGDDGYSDPYSDSIYETAYDSSGCGGCEDEEKVETSRNSSRRNDLRMIARGHRPRSPLQRSLSFSPILLAFVVTRFMRPRRRRPAG